MLPTVLFLCPHGAAKSIIAAAYFRRLARQQGMNVEAIAAGIHPDAEISPLVVELLAKEGYDLSDTVPQLVTQDQILSAFHVVSGCELATLPPSNTTIEQWDDVPPPSQDLLTSRSKIYEHVVRLVEQYKSNPD